MSKGSRRRGQQVSSETMDTNWANTFGKKKEPAVFKRWMCKSCNSHYTEIEIKFPCTTCGGDDFISEDYGAHAEVKPYDTIDEK